MELTIIGIVFGSLIIMFAVMFIPQGKVRLSVFIASGILYFLVALFQFIKPTNTIMLHIPQIFLKLITLFTTTFLFIKLLWDKQYGLSLFTFIQTVVLILTEILVSPDEAKPFLSFHYESEMLLLTGAFIIAVTIPVLFPYMRKRNRIRLAKDKNMNYLAAGFFMYMASFSGLLTANSLNGLFLFWQWGFIAKVCLLKAFGISKKERLLLIQQLTLTVWIVMTVFVYLQKGSQAIADITALGHASGLIAVLIFITVLIMTMTIPEKIMIQSKILLPTPVMGLSVILFSLIVPFALLFKFRPLLLSVDDRIASSVVFFGGLLMVSNAFYAGVSRRATQLLCHMTLFVCGWGMAGILADVESVFFSLGYVIIVSFVMAFLFNCATVAEYVTDIRDIKQAQFLAAEMPVMAVIVSFTLALFLFAPFCFGLLRLVLVRFMSDHPLALLLVALGTTIMTGVVLRWLSVLLTSGFKTSSALKKKGLLLAGNKTHIAIIIVSFTVMIGLNLLAGQLYIYLQNQPIAIGALPAADIETYTELPGVINLLRWGTGSIYIVISIIILVVLLIVIKISSGEKNRDDNGETSVFCPYSVIGWLPVGNRWGLCIRAMWVLTIMFLMGVAVSCLKL